MSWRTTTLGELCAEGGGSIQTGPFGSQLHASDYVISGIPSVMPQNIGDNVINEGDIARIQESDAQRLSKYRLQAGDIVYSRRGDVEKRALVRPENDGWLCGTGCLRVRLGDANENNSAFISYLLGAPDIRKWIVRHAVGATMPNLNTSILSAVPLTVPSPDEQNAIAEVLGTLDEKIAVNKRLAENAYLLAGFIFDMTLATDTTGSAPLGEMATTVLGGTPSRDNVGYWTNGTVPWLNSGKANEDRIIEPSELITEEALARSAAKLMPTGTTLVAITGATLGQVARLEISASGNQSLVGIWSDNKDLNDWLYFAVRHRIPGLLTRATGAAQQHVNKKDVDSLEVPVLSQSALEKFGSQVVPLLDSAAVADRESLVLASARDSLLPHLMSGKLRVRDADETITNIA